MASEIPSVELQYQTNESETKIDAMLINSRAILRAWDFILEKQKVGREMFILHQSVSDGVRKCQLLKEMVLIGMMTAREAYLTARTALNTLEQLYLMFRTLSYFKLY